MKRQAQSHFGPISASGATAPKAKAAALALAEASLRRLAEGVFIGLFEGVEFFIEPQIGGFGYGFMRNAAGEWAPRCVCSGNWECRPDVLKSVVAHIAGNAWRPGMNDDLADKAHSYLVKWANHTVADAVRSEILSRFEWQRRYAAAIEAGADANAAHEIASGLRRVQPSMASAGDVQ